MSFSDFEYAGKRKQIRRERFLAEMEQVVPWSGLVALIEPHYPFIGAFFNGRSPPRILDAAAQGGLKPVPASRLRVRIPRSSGHPFHKHLTTDSTVIRPPIPRVSDH